MAIDRAGTTTSRLTVDDWVQAGFAILAEEGIKALKIDRLCGRLGGDQRQFLLAFHRYRRLSRGADRSVG